jgi:hypothetical protein
MKEEKATSNLVLMFVGRLLNQMILVLLLCGGAALADDQTVPERSSRREPPPRAFEDCRGRKAGDRVQHTTPEGLVEAVCENTPQGLAARPVNPPSGARERGPAREVSPTEPRSRESGSRYSLSQAMSDKAQLNTIAFNGLAFLTGDFGADTFLPPGKVSDYFGFQYLRDTDAAGEGHNTSFLTRIANNMLLILKEGQKEELLNLAKRQAPDIRRFAEMRFPLIMAFRRNLEGELPPGSSGLDRKAVIRRSASLYELDGLLAYDRARVMGRILYGLSASQKEALAKLKFGDSRTWPNVPEPMSRGRLPHEINVAIMTYASEMYSWYAGSPGADAYFCPERHGMYFGGFGLKTAPAMGRPNYAISTSLTGDAGETFLAVLTMDQRSGITRLVDLQRQDLQEIARVRQKISLELRKFLKGEVADKEVVLRWSRRYGELDGALSYLYAAAFAKVGRTLAPQQKDRLSRLREPSLGAPKGPFLYSTPIAGPEIGNINDLFLAK